jgi:putative N6-adenine-specific DNA methylase
VIPVNKSIETFFAPCPRGLEGILASELEGLGAQALAPTLGGVGFTGPFDLCYRVNLESRVASRVLLRVGHGRYGSEQDVYALASDVPWAERFSPRCTIKVKVSAQRCPLKSLDFVTLRIKDAICDRFARRGLRPSVDTSKPDMRIDAFLDATHVTLYLDTSGEALFKRGLRQAGAEAPLRENLAAGILKLSGWTGTQPLLDPMCGGGTILMEAAHIALHRAPGLERGFAFEKLHGFDEARWRTLCSAARTRRIGNAPLAIHGCDKDQRAIETARVNLEAAGLAEAVSLTQADILDLTPPAAEGILIMNPPYGVRLGREDELVAFYPRLGDVLKQRFPGWRAYIFTADPRLPKLIGLAPTRRTPLFNGALECRLFEFKIVRGSARGTLR